MKQIKVNQLAYDQRLLDLYDGFAHGLINRREFLERAPAAEDVAKIRASLRIHHAALDERVNAGWPAYKAALEAAGRDYSEYTYENTNHGFHNDTTPRYDKEAAALAWRRTVEFFRKNLV